jgi:hypothetical protein
MDSKGLASYPTVPYASKTLAPGGIITGYYTIAGAMTNMLTQGTQYEYWLTVDSIKDIAEGNENNNDFRINIRAGY